MIYIHIISLYYYFFYIYIISLFKYMYNIYNEKYIKKLIQLPFHFKFLLRYPLPIDIGFNKD